MQMSNAGLNLLREFEGLRTSVYKDVAGLDTIGYGHRVLPAESFPSGITPAQADQILSGDVAIAEAAVTRLLKVPVNQGQFDALVDFTFNLGAARLGGSTLLRELNAGHPATAAQELLKWDHCNGVVNAGLLRRRKAELALWTAADPAPDPATAPALQPV